VPVEATDFDESAHQKWRSLPEREELSEFKKTI